MEVVNGFVDDDGMTQAAALAFYTGLALAPTLTISVWITQVFVGAEAKDKILEVCTSVLGPSAAAPIGQLLEPATQADRSWSVAGLVSILVLVFSASGVFAQLQSALNVIFHVVAKPGSSVTDFLRKRLLSFGMLLSLLFLMLVSMIFTVVLSAVLEHTGGGSVLWPLINFAVSTVVTFVVFVLVFTYMPDVEIPRKNTYFGAAITTVLFLIGKLVLSAYLGNGSYETSYGAAIGSFMALLAWVYYTSIIVFLGAESTKVFARRRGDSLQAEPHAMITKRVLIDVKTDRKVRS